MIDIIRQGSDDPVDPGGERIDIIGKVFSIAPVSDFHRIVVHSDFPLISEKDIEYFTAVSIRNSIPTMSCQRAKVHPYRVMVIGDDGYDGFLADIPQSIRGNRHLYPEVFELVPALIAIPPGVNAHDLNLCDAMGMYEMEEGKLLDKSKQIGRLLLKCSRTSYSD
jgi:hypothetical protein